MTKLEEWAEESRSLADKAAYSLNGTPIPAVFRFGHDDHPKASDLSPLPSGYARQAQKVAEKQVVLAGYRLGDRLKEVLP